MVDLMLENPGLKAEDDGIFPSLSTLYDIVHMHRLATKQPSTSTAHRRHDMGGDDTGSPPRGDDDQLLGNDLRAPADPWPVHRFNHVIGAGIT